MPKSAIWRHFTAKDAEKRVICLFCPQQLSVANGSTCSLIRHMRKKHPGVDLRRRSSEEREVVLVNDDDTDANSESPKAILEYEIEEDSEPEDRIFPLDQKRVIKTYQANTSKSKLNVEQQIIPAMTEAKRQIEDALDSMKSLKRKIDDEDEYDHFGRLIASKIRKIQDTDKREIVMRSVYNVVYEAFVKES